MQTLIRTHFSTIFNVERHRVWQLVLSGCALFWILAVVAVMAIR